HHCLCSLPTGIFFECNEVYKSFAFKIAMYSVLTIAVLLTVVSGNLFVIISICHFKQLHTPTNMFVVSLAVADFFVGMIVMPFQFSTLIEHCWYFGDLMCFFHYGVYLLLTSASVCNLVFISLDRYLAVCNPFFYNARVTVSRSLFCVFLSWLSSLLYILAYIYSEGNYFREDCVGVCEFDYISAWGLADLLFTFILPFSVMTCLYTRIIIVASRHARAIRSVKQKADSSKNRKNKISKSERKAAKTLGTVVATFMLCWLPSLLMSVFYEYAHITSNIFYDIYLSLGMVGIINSAAQLNEPLWAGMQPHPEVQPN
uniref:G-protein coupled receptors family 1 profile domain-containing protein n=1 Tax=Erpetoichthys calabaricus TaxID=27687 RepID=A0A8C4RHJ5_ERPCA